MRLTTGQALTSLCPSANFSVSEENDGTNVQIYWHEEEEGQTQPTDAEIQTEINRLQEEYDKNKYQRDRKLEYPSIEECIHAILDDELDALQIKRKLVKDKYPKE